MPDYNLYAEVVVRAPTEKQAIAKLAELLEPVGGAVIETQKQVDHNRIMAKLMG